MKIALHKSYPKPLLASVLLLIIAAILVFSNTFENPFIWDDQYLIVDNVYIKSFKNIPYFFSIDYWKNFGVETSGQYRPLRSLSFAGDFYLWKLNPAGFHLTNLLLHILNVILIYFLIFKLTASESISFLTALFFAVHPIHTESVTWIKNRQDLLACLFFLSALLFFIKSRLSRKVGSGIILYFLALFSFLLALYSKEMAISLPLILGAYTLLFYSPSEYKAGFVKILPFLALAGFYLLFKKYILGALISAEHAYKIDIYPHILVVIKTIGYYLYLLIAPFNLCADHAFTIPKSFFTPAVFLPALLLCVLPLILARGYFRLKSPGFKRDTAHLKLFLLGILWIFLTLLPVSNIIFLARRPIAEQRLYIPSLGFCILLALMVRRFTASEKRSISGRILKYLAVTFFIFLLLLYSFTAFWRNFDWQSPLYFWSRTLKASPHSARAYNGLGNALRETGNYAGAVANFSRALKIKPDYVAAINNLGNAFTEIGAPQRAVALYRKAIEIKPDYPAPYNNLGTIYIALNRPKEAIALYKQAIEIRPHYARAHNNLGNAYNAIGDRKKAIDAYKQAIAIDPEQSSACNNLGNTYVELGRFAESTGLYQQAIKIKPGYFEAHNNLGTAYYLLKSYDQAVLSYQRAIQANPRYADAYYNLGSIYSLGGSHSQALPLYQKVVEINPRHARAYNNLGTTYYNWQQYDQAIKHYRKALEVSPDYRDVHYNLGLTYTRLENYKEAIAAYQKAIAIFPEYAAAEYKLAEIYQQQKKRRLARKHCRRALELGFKVPAEFLKTLKIRPK